MKALTAVLSAVVMLVAGVLAVPASATTNALAVDDLNMAVGNTPIISGDGPGYPIDPSRVPQDRACTYLRDSALAPTVTPFVDTGCITANPVVRAYLHTYQVEYELLPTLVESILSDNSTIVTGTSSGSGVTWDVEPLDAYQRVRIVCAQRADGSAAGQILFSQRFDWDTYLANGLDRSSEFMWSGSKSETRGSHCTAVRLDAFGYQKSRTTSQETEPRVYTRAAAGAWRLGPVVSIDWDYVE